MTAPIEQFSFKPTSNAAVPTYFTGSVKRAFGDWAGDVLNVKNFGATGDGSTDDTTAIQACLNAAYNLPGGNGSTSTANLPVFFPAGHYIVNTPAAQITTVTGAASGAGSAIALAVTSSAGFAEGQRVQVAGVLGTTEANNLWYIHIIDSTHILLNGSAFVHAWSAGGTQTVKGPCLSITNTQGLHLYGATKTSSKIDSATGVAPVLSMNGVGYGQIDNLDFNAAAGGYAIDHSWDNIQVSSQELLYLNCSIGGGDYGLSLGTSGFQTSEIGIIQCSFGVSAKAGIFVNNQNCLQINVIGGNIQSCGIGIWVKGGALEVIEGVGFQGSTTVDIEVDGSQGDGLAIISCRSESVNFATIHSGLGVHMVCCSHLQASAGTFLFYETGNPSTAINSCMIDSCISDNGIIAGTSNGKIYIRGGNFINAGFIPGSLAGKILDYNLGPVLFAALPAPQTALTGLRETITDCLVAASGNFAANVTVGGGGNTVPLWCDGTNWKIG